MKFNTLRIAFVALFALALTFTSCSEEPEAEVYMFSYFKGGSQDGLHLAYSHDGYNWTPLKGDSSFLKPAVADDLLMRDPCIIRGNDGLFHMVWTVSWEDRGIGYASSKDLVNWNEQQFIPLMMDEDSARNCWAPEIFLDDETGNYMIYWATTIDGKFTETRLDMERGYNHRMYYVLTKDFKEFSKPELLYEPGFNVIDATIHKDNGKYIMFRKTKPVYRYRKTCVWRIAII